MHWVPRLKLYKGLNIKCRLKVWIIQCFYFHTRGQWCPLRLMPQFMMLSITSIPASLYYIHKRIGFSASISGQTFCLYELRPPSTIHKNALALSDKGYSIVFIPASPPPPIRFSCKIFLKQIKIPVRKEWNTNTTIRSVVRLSDMNCFNMGCPIKPDEIYIPCCARVYKFP